MNLPVGDWLPSSSAVNLLAGLFLLSALYAVGQRRAAACIRGLAWNALSLGLIAALMAGVTRERHLWIAALLVLVIKGIAIPRLLSQLHQRLDASETHEPKVPIPAAMVLCGLLVVLAFGETRALFGSTDSVLASCLPVSVASALVGLVLMVVRHEALLQIVGLVIVQNAIFLAAISLTYGMPLVVEIGVLLDVLVGVAVLGMFVPRAGRGATASAATTPAAEDAP